MKNKRNIAAGLVLMLILAFTLSACGSKNTASNAAGGTDVGSIVQGETNKESTESGGDANGDNAESSSPAQPAGSGSDLVIQTKDISETAMFYPVTVDGTKMEVLAVTAPDGTIRTAFNTCQVCNGSPYAYFVQKDDTLECQNCGNLFPMDRVGVEAGGCNPVPIFDEDKTVTDETITVSYEILQANASLFPSNWKSE